MHILASNLNLCHLISNSMSFFDSFLLLLLVRFDLRVFRWTQVMIFAVEEINKESALLPNISLGYRILNSCASPTNTLRAALTLASQPEDLKQSSRCPPAISALIAESGSSQSIAVAGTLGPFQMPIVRNEINFF